MLEKLAKDWAKKYNHNPKVLVRWICNSQAYGLCSRANKWNDKTEDESLFARMLFKPMTPEQMFTSVLVATHPRWQTMSEEKKQKNARSRRKGVVSRIGRQLRQRRRRRGSYSGTVIQALLLMNGKDINATISEKEGAVDPSSQKRGTSYVVVPVRHSGSVRASPEPRADAKGMNDLMRPGVFNSRPNAKRSPRRRSSGRTIARTSSGP